ncbi:hypothetical protein K438DRAFT_1777843 [Mycena galopus ATCC 62051]|nr:hypothetical protein K438DRAFT_1777843 [Mycena galopus ATCC 62051]
MASRSNVGLGGGSMGGELMVVEERMKVGWKRKAAMWCGAVGFRSAPGNFRGNGVKIDRGVGTWGWLVWALWVEDDVVEPGLRRKKPAYLGVGGLGRTWADVGWHGRTWADVGRRGRTWADVGWCRFAWAGLSGSGLPEITLSAPEIILWVLLWELMAQSAFSGCAVQASDRKGVGYWGKKKQDRMFLGGRNATWA